MQIYIRRDKKDFGPYSREAVLEYVRTGVFQAGDKACYSGKSEWKPVGELIGMAGDSEPARLSKRGKFSPPAAGRAQASAATRRHRAGRRKVFAPEGEKHKNSMIVLNLVLIMLVVAGAYVRFGKGGDAARRCISAISGLFSQASDSNLAVSTTPAPETATPAIEQQRVKVETPASAPPAPSISAPLKPFSLADIAGNPGAWPKTLKLKQAINFPAVVNSQVVGSVAVPAGTVVKLVNIQGDQLTLEYQGGTQNVSWKLTDLDKEVFHGGSVAPDVTPAAGASSQQPAEN